jgi:methyl-accepting chemotaxis protein
MNGRTRRILLKLKYKLSLLVIAIMTFVISGIAMLLLYRATNITRDLTLRGIRYLANDQATY